MCQPAPRGSASECGLGLRETDGHVLDAVDEVRAQQRDVARALDLREPPEGFADHAAELEACEARPEPEVLAVAERTA